MLNWNLVLFLNIKNWNNGMSYLAQRLAIGNVGHFEASTYQVTKPFIYRYLV